MGVCIGARTNEIMALKLTISKYVLNLAIFSTQTVKYRMGGRLRSLTRCIRNAVATWCEF